LSVIVFDGSPHGGNQTASRASRSRQVAAPQNTPAPALAPQACCFSPGSVLMRIQADATIGRDMAHRETALRRRRET